MYSPTMFFAGAVTRILPFLAGLLLMGCATDPKPPLVPMVPLPPPAALSRGEANSGSLWREDTALSRLFIDPKARTVGDIVTVSIVETSTASNGANTQTGRKSSLGASVESFLGLEKKYADSTGFNPFGAIKGSMDSSFDGSGTTSRSGKLAASMTARVIELLPNGNLRIMGSREVTVNHEEQIITLEGTVRPRDISPENVILSTFISEAKITYTGNGIVQEGQRPGWFSRVMNVVWPF